MTIRTTTITFVWEDHDHFQRPDGEIEWDYYLRMGDIDCGSAEVINMDDFVARSAANAAIDLARGMR